MSRADLEMRGGGIVPRNDLEVRGGGWGQHVPNTSTGTGPGLQAFSVEAFFGREEGVQNKSCDKNYMKEVRAR